MVVKFIILIPLCIRCFFLSLFLVSKKRIFFRDILGKIRDESLDSRTVPDFSGRLVHGSNRQLNAWIIFVISV